MNVVRLASVLGSLLGNKVDHVVVAGQKIDGAVDVEDVHPASSIDAAIPPPDVGVTAVLLLRAEDGRCNREGDHRP